MQAEEAAFCAETLRGGLRVGTWEQAERGLTLTLLMQGDVAAFFVADLGAVMRKHLCFLKCLPRVRPFYTVKCNSSPGVLKVLAELGLGFSCANKVSLWPPRWHLPLAACSAHTWLGCCRWAPGEAGVPSGKGRPLGRWFKGSGREKQAWKF